MPAESSLETALGARRRTACGSSSALLLAWATAAVGCPYCIRDSGYIVREPKPYRVCFFVNDQTPNLDSLPQRVTTAASALLADSNVEAKLIHVERQKGDKLLSCWKAAGSPKPPAAILVSPRDDVLRLSGIGPGEVSERALRRILASAVTSPARRKLTQSVVRPWCVILLARGTDAAANQDAAEAVKAAAATVRDTLKEAKETRFGLPETVPVSLTDPGERVFLWSLGLLEGGKASPRVAVIFGHGRRLGTMLKGSQITQEKVAHLLWLLGQNCACTSDPSWLLGPVAPLVWPRQLEGRVADILGFDPNSPAVFSTLSGVWSSIGKVGGGPAPDTDLGYVEFATPDTSKPTAAAQIQPDAGTVAATASNAAPGKQAAAQIKATTARPKNSTPAKPKSAASAAGSKPPPNPLPATMTAGEPGTGASNAAMAKESPSNPGARPEEAGMPGKGEQKAPTAAPPTPASSPVAASEPGRLESSAQPDPATPATRRGFANSGGEPGMNARVGRLLGLFLAVLGLLALGGGTALVVHRRKHGQGLGRRSRIGGPE